MIKKGRFTQTIRFVLVIIFITSIFAPSGSPLSPATARAAADQPEGTELLSLNGAVSLTSDNQEPTPNAPEQNSDYFTSQTVTSGDGKSLDVYIIAGPPKPPAGYELERQSAQLPTPNMAMAIKTLDVPAYDWVFGCSATSGAMIAAYYDRNGFPNMYTGPANGGVMPLNNSQWSYWTDGGGTTYGQNPLVASRQGLDGRSSRGSIDDYWVAYDSSAQDPFITNGWPEHAWGDAIGDYMKTSQSNHGNTDGATSFYNWTSDPSRLTCDYLESQGIIKDGTVGRRLFYRAKGYTVTDCYNQKTENNGGGFTLAMYRAEIDAGRPVMLNLEGHTVVGVGYDDSTSDIYIHDTWDFNTYVMPWGGSYEGMRLLSVSIVNLTSTCSTPSTPSLIEPGNSAIVIDATPNFNWGTSTNANLYDFQLDDNSDFSSPIVNATNSSSLSYSASPTLANGTYYWRVRGHNTSGGCNVYSSWSPVWSFSVNLNGTPPGAFYKSDPSHLSTDQPTTLTLSWGSSSYAASYDYCIDTTDDDTCSDWTPNGTATSKVLSGLSTSTTYYWHVRAVNDFGTAYADSDTIWSFTTQDEAFVYLPMLSYVKPPVPYSGKVLSNSTPLAGIKVNMAYSTNNGSTWNETYASATTNSQGVYTFPSTPEVGNGKKFVVYYNNTTYNTNYLWYFECGVVDSTSDQYKCDINLRDVVMKSPGKNAIVGPSVSFTWTKRATTSDNYKWFFIDPGTNNYLTISNLKYIDHIQINFCEFAKNYKYLWRIDVYTPYGFGIGYEDRGITFNSMPSCSNGATAQGLNLEKNDMKALENSSLLSWLLKEGLIAYPGEK